MNATDQIVARLNTTSAFTALKLITPTVSGAQGLAAPMRPQAVGGEPTSGEDGTGVAGPFGILTLSDGRVVVYARGMRVDNAGLEMTRLGGNWEAVTFESSVTRDQERYWMVGAPESGEGLIFRLTLP